MYKKCRVFNYAGFVAIAFSALFDEAQAGCDSTSIFCATVPLHDTLNSQG